jgi:hypothetical protein
VVWVAALAIGLVAGFATGGKIANLARLRFRWPWLVVAALVVRVVTVLPPLTRIDGSRWAYVAALTTVLAWTIWHIDRLPGIWLLAAGSAVNLFVIAANGGRMPVAPQLAGALVQRGQIGQYTLMGPGTQLNWLADWIALPGPLENVLREAYSPGDLIIAVGIATVVVLAMRARPAETRRRIVNDPP